MPDCGCTNSGSCACPKGQCNCSSCPVRRTLPRPGLPLTLLAHRDTRSLSSPSSRASSSRRVGSSLGHDGV
ncbi:hypothetical protein B0T18DRAFT_326834 [Schizothecium vesticola]|uniref:Metallothionein n=1 Tax=Schizothecium vesticola TaxID=314040 RepID=A0AA40K5H2_9PEZI|nr:hypothetical protein B0T18DRAFT_326834 [Schizothecium vesticola]